MRWPSFPNFLVTDAELCSLTLFLQFRSTVDWLWLPQFQTPAAGWNCLVTMIKQNKTKKINIIDHHHQYHLTSVFPYSHRLDSSPHIHLLPRMTLKRKWEFWGHLLLKTKQHFMAGCPSCADPPYGTGRWSVFTVIPSHHIIIDDTMYKLHEIYCYFDIVAFYTVKHQSAKFSPVT